MTNKLSERAKQLIPKARIVSFETWKDSQPEGLIEILQKADDEGRYLTDGDLEQMQNLSINNLIFLDTVRFLRENVAEIIVEARKEVLAQFPNITEPGGDLYPAERAEACWRDFWHFLRCITYGIAGQDTQFTSSEGLYNMELLYQELRVPLKAMVVGLEALKTASLKRVESDRADAIAPYFDRLIEGLKSFNN